MDTTIVLGITSGSSLILAAVGLGFAIRRAKVPFLDELQAKLAASEANVKALNSQLADTSEKLAAAERKVSVDLLKSYAKLAVDYAGKVHAKEDRLLAAVEAVRRFDAEDNQSRDWTDAQIRIAVEAAVSEKEGK